MSFSKSCPQFESAASAKERPKNGLGRGKAHSPFFKPEFVNGDMAANGRGHGSSKSCSLEAVEETGKPMFELDLGKVHRPYLKPELVNADMTPTERSQGPSSKDPHEAVNKTGKCLTIKCRLILFPHNEIMPMHPLVTFSAVVRMLTHTRLQLKKALRRFGRFNDSLVVRGGDNNWLLAQQVSLFSSSIWRW